MKEMRDSEIRLFGKKIALPENARIVQVVTVEDENDCESNQNSSGSDSARSLDGRKVSKDEESELVEDEKEEVEQEQKQEVDEDCLAGDCCETKPEEKDQDSIAEEMENSKALSESDDSPNSPPMDEDSPIKESENDENDANQQQKKKPDKIIPCPRCNSMDTKFCYYNNYNVNQPRHFCKSCQRYWTAGGTMRNVPVGAGRRKNKNSSSHCRHITISEALQAARSDAPNGFHHSTFKPNGTVLSFGPDIPLCDSMASVLNLTQEFPNGTRNGFYKVDPGRSVSCKGAENGDDCSSGSSITTSNSMVEGGKNGQQEPVIQHINGFHSPVPCLPGVPWPYPWNSAVPLPAICPSAFPMPFYPAPYWNCSVPGAWSVPWMPPVSPTASQRPTGSGPNSPTLGKHSRNGELLNKPKSPEGKESSEKKNSEPSVLVPKTLRIDDPDEAAKSSIWTTLGIKYDSVSRGGLFKAFQPKSDKKKHMATTSPVLQANPAALSRSFTFQETA